MGSVYFIAVLLCMFSCQRKIIRNPLFLIVATVLLFYAAFSVNNTAIGQQAIDNANRTVSLNSAPENEAIVAIPTPSADDLSPETEQQQAGTKEKVLENSDESNDDDNGAHDKVEQAEIQKDKVSESDQTREDTQAQASEIEEKEDNSNALEEENDIDDDDESNDEDIPFVLPFP
jgi:type IV secretory pathway VirB10-like protein